MKLFIATLLVVAVTADRLDNTYLPPSNARTAGGSGNFLNTPFKGGASSFGGKSTFGPGASAGFSGAPAGGVGAGFGGAPAGGVGAGFGGAPAGGVGAGFGGAGAGFGGKGAYNGAGTAGGYGGAGGYSGAGSFAQSKDAGAAILRLDNENNGDGSYQYNYETENRIQAHESGQLKNAGNEEINAVQGSYSYVGDDGQTYSVNYVSDEYGFRPEGAHLPTPPPVPAEIQKALEQNAAEEARGIVDDGSYRGEAGGTGQYSAGGAGGYSAGGRSGAGQYNAGGNGGHAAGGAGAYSSGGAAASRQYLAPKTQSNNANEGYRY